jgi:hypothetical protein
MAHSVIRMARMVNEPGSVDRYDQTRKGAMEMNSYVNLILDAKGATERLQQLFRSAPEPARNDHSLSSIVSRNQRQKRKRRRLVGPTTTPPCRGLSPHARESWVTQLGNMSIDASIWIASASLGLVIAAASKEPLRPGYCRCKGGRPAPAAR